MTKKDMLDLLLKEQNGIITTAGAIDVGVSKTYFSKYIKDNDLERVAHGIYASNDSWGDPYYILQLRFQNTVFSHETALYLLGLADREPLQLSVTAKDKYNSPKLVEQGVKIYRIKKDLFEVGLTKRTSAAGHTIRIYNAERSICDLIRSRSQIEIQDFQTAINEYVRSKEKDIPLLMSYAKMFRTEKLLNQYLEVLL